ncbi:zinc ribbon domain-containing protein [Clostridium sp. OS1-26]|uniref:zinc ribbon domain-containing protein n=1 Tax=Clostridium sp. OS1-26 TaxID=3070681 RepID=UPI0027E0BA06|nr:zinc ribbon domain-containing protein [Clostridium sp. OS1-26]WML33776.1 zinc ribbon domain-containing protein [Clostridium sp. OS1-26]
MFFVGIFGIEDKKKEIRAIRNLSCKNCDAVSGLTLFKVYSYFHIFFLPLFRWNERYYLVCNRCNSMYEISKEKGIRAERGEEEAITYWDLKSMEYGYYNNHVQHKCKNCGKEIESNFEYCPYCGKRRE